MVNKMPGKAHKTRSFSIQRDGIISNGENLASALNEFHVSLNSDIPPVDKRFPAGVPTCNKLRAPKIHKAAGPDKIPNRARKEFAYILAEPIATIFIKSLSSSIVF